MSAPLDSPSRSAASPRRSSVGIVLWAAFLAITVSQFHSPLFALPGRLQAWGSLWVAICVQALPFLVLGVLVSASIATFVPASFLGRMTPPNPFWAVPAAGAAGVALPGCECSSVPVAASLMRRGVSPAAALSFLLASPSLNPVVIVSTAVAFYGLPQMAWARFAAAVVAVLCAGWLWLIVGDNSTLAEHDERLGECAPSKHCAANAVTRGEVFRDAALADFFPAASYLVVGAALAAAVKVIVPAQWFLGLADTPWLLIAVMVVLAIVLSLCSEADAFVAASFTAVSPTAQLVFLVVGPIVDFKLIAMQLGAFGRGFVLRFVPVVLLSAIASACVVGVVFFGGL